jgi:hypothetical protein
MGRLECGQEQLFYAFNLDKAVAQEMHELSGPLVGPLSVITGNWSKPRGVPLHAISAPSRDGMADLDRISTRPIQWRVSERSPTVLSCPATICACHSGSRVTARIVRHWSQRNSRTGTVAPETSLRARRDTIMMLGRAAHFGHLPFKVASALCIKNLVCAGDETYTKMAAPRGDGQK